MEIAKYEDLGPFEQEAYDEITRQQREGAKSPGPITVVMVEEMADNLQGGG